MGIATWNLEYRRTGHTGGGWPGTAHDVLNGAVKLEAIAEQYQLRLDSVIAIGYSAGGQLALWLAAQRLPFQLRGVVSLAGVVDLRRAWDLQLSSGVVKDFMNGTPEEVLAEYRKASPIELLPLGLRTRLVHGTEDASVPHELSVSFLQRAKQHGDDCQLVSMAGATHYDLIDPSSSHWSEVERTVLEPIRSYHHQEGAGQS
jgi:acetyl esterase/lipase